MAIRRRNVRTLSTRPRALRFACLAAAIAASTVALGCRPDPGLEPWEDPVAAAEPATPQTRERCDHFTPRRQALFGDLHVHTALSMDARSAGTRTRPDAAYRFARGESIPFGPWDDAGRPTSRVQIDRPLDFAAITDHAEWLGETRLCSEPESEVYESQSCRIFRGEAQSMLGRLLGLRGSRSRYIGLLSLTGRNDELCGDGNRRCRQYAGSAWQELQAAAERWYDRSAACTFTTFHGYEYSRSPQFTKIHRNVIFRNEIVPELPISWVDTPTEPEFWGRLRELCNDSASGCDAIAIPHNPNLSNGRLFTVDYRDLEPEAQRERARLRAGLEPIVEMVQFKGESECRNGLYGVVGGADELCDFEKIRDFPGRPVEDCEEEAGSGAQAGRGCISRLDYVRYALVEGLREDERIGVNPYKFGFIGSTDGHAGLPGDTRERDSGGAFRQTDATLLEMGEKRRPSIFRSAGGVAGVWAEENSRDSIFSALERREAFATSGPRIAPRFFGGWDLPSNACERSDLVEAGYAGGVPMGGDLPARPKAARSPRFVVQATRDPESTGLQRAQIVKVWLGTDGLYHQAVHEVAGDKGNAASVDLATCEPRGVGADSLCGVWEDPDFDASQAAVYYARVVENPSCRWSTWGCNALPAADRPDGCSDPRVPKTIQERAWTSPIWWEPEGA